MVLHILLRRGVILTTILALTVTFANAAPAPSLPYIGAPPSPFQSTLESRLGPNPTTPFLTPSFPSTASSQPGSSSSDSSTTINRASTPEVTIAYFIQISTASLSLTPRLLRRLHHPANHYVLHFDAKIPTTALNPIISAIRTNPTYTRNVHLLPQESVTYRGVTMILNTLSALDFLLSVGPWQYFINLSGSDYPLVPPTQQRQLLALPYVTARAANFFTVSPQQQWPSGKRFRYRNIAVDLALGGTIPKNDSASMLRILPHAMPLYDHLTFRYAKAEGWAILTRPACDFLLRSAYARKMLLAMGYSQDPSEHYYISVFVNHPRLNATIVPHSLRTVYWKLNGTYAGQHPYVIDSLREEDGSYTVWKFLRRSPHFFARKFSQPDSPILDLIDNEMNGLGNNVNHTAVQQSWRRVQLHLQWVFGLMPRRNNTDRGSAKNSNQTDADRNSSRPIDEKRNKDDSNDWPTR